MTAPQSFSWNETVRRSPLTTGALMFLSMLLSIALSHFSGHVTSMWLANGLIVAWMLPIEKRAWPQNLAATVLANIAAGMLAHYPLALTLISAWANVLEILLVLAYLQPVFDKPSGKLRISAPRFTIVICALVALAIASCMPLVLRFYPCDYPKVLTNWFCSDSLGMLFVVILASFARRREFAAAFQPNKQLGTWGCLGLVLAVTLLVFSQRHFPLAFLTASALVFVVFRRGVAVATLALFLHGLVATSLTIRGLGPIALISHVALLERVIFLQIYLFITLITVFPIGQVWKKQLRLEQLYELLANNSRDVVTRSNLQGKRLFCSPSVEAVLGWSLQELVGVPVEDILHPQDRSRYHDLLARFREGLPSAVFNYRVRMKSGEYIWMEARMRMLREAVSGQPHEIISTARDVSERVAAEQKLQAAYAGMQRLASTDPLTGVANRRVFDETLEREWRRAMRERTPLALLMLDADFFKAYNDALGHQAGDDCLRRIAHCLADVVQRPGDLPARYGGEEFAALLPVTDEAGAVHIGHRIMEAVAALDIEHPNSPLSTRLTLSVGVASMLPVPGSDPDMLVAAADRALYAAKKAGRNRIEASLAHLLEQTPAWDSANSGPTI